MNDAERLNLKKMVKEFKTEETTDRIRELKHSKKIKRDVDTMIMLKSKYPKLKKEMLQTMAQNKCIFLWENYTNIFNKLFGGYIDVNMLYKFINVLALVEEGEYDQHEASMVVGKILKEIYIDSALREGNEKDKQHDKKVKKKEKKRKTKNLSWKDYKKMNLSV
jgi:hypothetical protein